MATRHLSRRKPFSSAGALIVGYRLTEEGGFVKAMSGIIALQGGGQLVIPQL